MRKGSRILSILLSLILLIISCNSICVFNSKANNESTLLIDKVEPCIKDDCYISKIKWQEDQETKGKTIVYGSFGDEDSGIASIKYKVNNGYIYTYGEKKSDFIEGNSNEEININHKPNEKVDFKIELSGQEDYKVDFIVTDNVGNEYNCSSDSFKATSTDNVPPVIKNVLFEPDSETIKKEPDKKFEDISAILYSQICIVKSSFTIKVDAEDVAPENVVAAGIRTVELYSGDKKIGTLNLIDNLYQITIKEYITAEPMIIKVTDNKGNLCEKKISEIDNNKKDIYFKEEIKPSVNVEYKNSVDVGGKHWFNKAGGDFIVTATDNESGIKNITISEDGKNYISKTLHDYKKSEEVKIDTSTLTEGEHIFTVSVTDNCGNEFSNTYPIFVDHSEPSISYKIQNSNGVVIDGADWYDKNDVLSITATIHHPENVPIGEVEFQINGKIFSDFYTLKETSDTKEVTLEISVKNILENGGNAIELKGYVKSESGNSNNYHDVYKCNIDKDIPKIDSITIDKIDNMLFPTALNLINTGIFSNGSVKFNIKAEDAEGDSGIAYVEFAYNQDEKQVVQRMALTKDGFEYCLPFDLKSDTFYSDFKITAYDKYGKISKGLPAVNDSNGSSTRNTFIMQENKVPLVDINLEKSDGSVRTDGQIWYNKNKKVSINLQDMQSGIRYARIFVNDIELKSDVNGKKIIDSETSRGVDKNITSLTYNFSTDYIINKIGEAKDGCYKIKVEVSDNAGNKFVDNEKSFNIDKSNPKVDKVTFSTKSADDILSTDGFVTKLKYGYYFKNPFYLIVNTYDQNPSSGLSRVEYKLISYNDGMKGSTVSKTATIVNGVVRVDIPKDFKGQIHLKAIDMVGNESREVTTLGYVEDEKAPEIEIPALKETKYKDSNGNNLYSKNVSTNVTIRDLKSGLKTIEYFVDAENNSVEKKILKLDNEGYKEGDKLENGWIVTKMDNNLVVEVKQKFVFNSDDNNIIAFYKASDRSGNTTKYFKTQKFSIDKTSPKIRVDFANGVKSNPQYYNSSKKAIMKITVDERNFNEKLLDIKVRDSYRNNKVSPKFVKEKGKYSYVATIDYPEGDYVVQVSGKDIVQNKAIVYTNGKKKGKELYKTDFIVDTTSPSVSTNFTSFNNGNSEKGNFFNKKKTATITVKEHNFDPELMNLNVWEKAPGKGQNLKGAEKSSYVTYSGKGWSSNGDVHSIELEFERDGIYKVEIKPTDLAENSGDTDSTIVFEIDTTSPQISMINGESTDKKKTNIIDVYDEKRKDEASPSIEYFDSNFDCIKYEIVKYAPKYKDGKQISRVSCETIKRTLTNKKFKLEKFDKDGIYSVEMVAYDKAGNSSKVSNNTYVRMMKTDVLAYIEGSHPGVEGKKGTGWYSIEDKDGPLSKRPDNFEDLKIAVLAKNDSKVSITLNSNEGDVTDTGVKLSSKDKIYGAGVYRYVLSKDYFKDHYQEDTDATFYLTVNDSDNRVELGQIHIDNIAPEYKLPSYFHNWGWIKGIGEKSIAITDISEKIDTNSSFVYVDGKKVDYTYDSTHNKLTFSIEDGSHSVGISLMDNAGNEYNIPEISHLVVGNFRLYVAIGTLIILISSSLILVAFRRKRKVRNLE